jgi:hypothetical protein
MFRGQLLRGRFEPRESYTDIRVSNATAERSRASISHDVEYLRFREG